MSLVPQKPNRTPHKPKGAFFGPALAGACLAVVMSVPAAAYTAAFLGNTYEKRAMIYGFFLLWAVIGAVVIFWKTYQSETQALSFRRILLWFISAWLWPLLLTAGRRR